MTTTITRKPGAKRSQALLAEAVEKLQRNEAAEGEALLQQVIGLSADDAETLHAVGNLRAQQGRFAEAEELYRRSLAVNPDQPVALNSLGQALNRMNRNQEAIDAFRQAIILKPNFAEGHLNLGLAQSFERRHVEAEKSFRDALRLQPNLIMAKQSLVASLNEQRRYREAEALAVITIRQNRLDPRQASALYYNLGVAVAAQKRDMEALGLLNTAQGFAPDMPYVDAVRGSVLHRLGKLEDAIDAYRRAIMRNPLDLMAHRELNHLLYRLERNDEFLSSYDAAIDAVPGVPSLEFDRASLLLRAERFEEAKAGFEKGNAAGANNIVGHDGIGRASARLGDFEGAIAAHERAVGIEPGNAAAWCNFAETLLRAGDAKRALEAAEKSLAIQPGNPLGVAFQSLAMRKLGDEREAAINDYTRLVQTFDLETPDGFSDMESFNRTLNEALSPLHAVGREYLDQNVRGGTQTIDDLFAGNHPLIVGLRARFDDAVNAYIARMKDDPDHPLFGRKANGFGYLGAWTTRLKSGGQHLNHVHKSGWISSAYYVALPKTEGEAGWLKFGEAPFEMGLPEQVKRVVEPKVGRLVLFPSYMWHGTTPFQSDEARTTIAFDVLPRA
ncbi:MAG TPA: tetratricopeptide repeat protein [Rhizomicrobium sp.]|nr:tetratricopeptide repeat protein [Rhizomicrobium sp.]